MTGREATDSRDSGFTLVELLVGLALTSLLGVLLLDSMRTGLLTWRTIARHADHMDQVIVVQTQLRRLIGLAYPFYDAPNTTAGHVLFEGTPTALSFLATAPTAVQEAGRAKFVLSIEQLDGHLALTLASQPELPSRSQDYPSTSITLLRGLASASLTYLSQDRGGQNRGQHSGLWHDRWYAQAELPQLIRLDVAFPEGDPRWWPDFTIAPRLSVDVGCTHDPLTKNCRGR
jgi:general secretion pathway protein J